VDLGRLAADTLVDAQCQAGEKAFRCEYIEPLVPVRAHADRQMLHIALRCLLRNAVEAVPADGWVRVQVEQKDNQVQVVVSDSGPGPTLQQREHLFDPFYSGRSAGRGRGLGLPIAWRLAHGNGGDVSYSPLPDCPARFVLTLPAAAPVEQPADQPLEPSLERKSA
jgi:signal transduction histidine kinase